MKYQISQLKNGKFTIRRTFGFGIWQYLVSSAHAEFSIFTDLRLTFDSLTAAEKVATKLKLKIGKIEYHPECPEFYPVEIQILNSTLSGTGSFVNTFGVRVKRGPFISTILEKASKADAEKRYQELLDFYAGKENDKKASKAQRIYKHATFSV